MEHAQTRPMGVCAKDLCLTSQDARCAVEETARLGMTWCHLPGLSWLGDVEDAATVRSIRLAASRAHVELAISIGSVMPARPDRAPELAQLGGGDLRTGVLRAVQSAAQCGAREVHFTIGTLSDRVDLASWASALAESALEWREIAPRLRELGVKAVLKTHEEMTLTELTAWLDRVEAPDVVGVGLSPTNLYVTWQDPSAAAQRLAAHTAVFFVDDCALHWIASGVRRVLCELGTGDIPWRSILGASDPRRAVPIILDLHRAQFDIPLFAPGWVDTVPGLTVPEVLGLASTVRSGSREHAALADRRERGLRELRALAAA